MLFYMLEAESIEDMPKTNGQSIDFETFTLGKCAVISFSWFTTDSRIDYYTKALSQYLNEIKVIGIMLILFAVIFSQLAPMYDKKKYGRI